MPEIEKYFLKRAEIEKIKIPPGNRSVLIKTIERNVDRRTKSGIWMISETDTDWAAAVHAQRWGEVVAVPRDPLPFVRKKPGEEGQDLMPWQTTVEIGRGMMVWYDYLQSLNSIMYVDEDKSEYKLIDYSNLYVATWPRIKDTDHAPWQLSTDGKEWIFPLNGYHIFEQVYKKRQSDFDYFTDKKIDNRRGVVRFVASNNTDYENGMESDHIILKQGDEVQFGPVPAVTLEDSMHCFFDGGRMYRRAQARNVDLAWRDGELILPNGRLLLERIPDETVTKAGIILPKPNVKTHRGTVLVSSVEEAPTGSVVKYIKGAGMPLDYQGKKARVLKSEEILYIM